MAQRATTQDFKKGKRYLHVGLFLNGEIFYFPHWVGPLPKGNHSVFLGPILHNFLSKPGSTTCLFKVLFVLVCWYGSGSCHDFIAAVAIVVTTIHLTPFFFFARAIDKLTK